MSAVEHRPDYYYLALRHEYITICTNCTYKKPGKSTASPHCKALILAILEKWTDEKRKKGEEAAIYMTYPQWIEEMYGMFGRNVIIDSLDELLGEGLISREKHKMYGKETYKYRLNCQELNLRIKQLPSGDTSKNRRDDSETRLKINEDAFKNKRDNEECRLKINEVPFKNKRNIESSKESINIESERKNDVSRQNATVSTQNDVSHSFDHASLNFSSSQETKPTQETKPSGEKRETKQTKPEVVFSPEAAKVFQLAKELNLVALKGDEKDRDNCTILAEKGFTTLEKLDELMEFCWKERPYLVRADGKRKSLCLQNLVTEHPGLLQIQRRATAAPSATVAVSTMGKATIERIEADKQREQRILEKEAKEGKPPSLRERQAQLMASRRIKAAG